MKVSQDFVKSLIGRRVMTPRKKAGTFFLCASVSVLIQIATVPSASAGMILGSTASTFAILGGGGVTGAAPTNTINGNLGACCTTDTITGYPANFALTGTEYAGSVAPESLAQGDLTTAITALNGLASGPTTTESDLTGLTLPPGVYVSGSALPMSLSGTLNLDGGSNANALWVFLVGSSLTINSTSTVNVYNTGAGAGVYWVMGATAYLDPNSVLEGNFLAYAGIPVGTNVTDPCGRLLTQTGSVTLAGSDTIGIGCSGVLAGSNGLGGGGTLSTVNGVPTITPSPGASVPEPGAFFFVAPCLAGLMILGKRSRSKLGRARA